jgi:cell wall assembly regulator SMI1
MTSGVESSWDRIVAWLRDHAPVSATHLGPAATTRDISVVEALLGRPLPADLLEWWQRSCGATGFAEARLIPGYTPYTVEQAVECREIMLEVTDSDDADIAVLAAEPAGSPCTPGWLPMWLPIANDGMGCDLFIDLRSGPSHGCIMKWDKYEAVTLPPLWPSTAAMLSEIADALEHGTLIQGYHPEARDDGILDWV